MRNWRFNFILFLFFITAATILSRLVFLQVKKYEFYKALSEGQQKILGTETGERGEVFFKNGEPLAINKSGEYLFICPKEIKEKEQTSMLLSQVLNLDEKWILEKAKKNNLFEALKHNLSTEEQRLINEQDLTGVYTGNEVLRYYPQNELASNIIGFLGGDKKGQYGVEGFYDELLRGEEVLTEKEKGPFGFFTYSPKKSGGKNIFLTIDPSIQFTAHKLLSEKQKTLGFTSGQILVLEPFSGEIIASAQIPRFNPNFYSSIEDQEIFQNAISQKIFEPGSVFKPLTMAAALNEGRITPQTTYVDPGVIKIGTYEISNYSQRSYGEQTMTQVLEKSINTGAVFAEKQLGHQDFLDYVGKFGFFEKTGIDLQGEVFSENLEFKKGYEINFANASFGQGVEITSIQLIRAFATIANGGKLVTPHIIERTEPSTSLSFKEDQPVISQSTSAELTAMLISVVENGFAKKAGVEGYYVAGKTGTAQVSWPALGIPRRGYSEKTIQTFIGFAPALNPKFLIMVKLDDPGTKTAEYSAMPIFQELAQYIINYWEIPPDHQD